MGFKNSTIVNASDKSIREQTIVNFSQLFCMLPHSTWMCLLLMEVCANLTHWEVTTRY